MKERPPPIDRSMIVRRTASPHPFHLCTNFPSIISKGAIISLISNLLRLYSITMINTTINSFVHTLPNPQDRFCHLENLLRPSLSVKETFAEKDLFSTFRPFHADFGAKINGLVLVFSRCRDLELRGNGDRSVDR